MTKISIYALIVLGFSAFLSSCQIEKQYHSGGFKINGPQWRISSNESTIVPTQHKSGKSMDFQQSKDGKQNFNNTSNKKSTGLLQGNSMETKIVNANNTLFQNGPTRLHSYSNYYKSFNSAPPDTVVIYDTVFEEDVLIIPDSIKKQSDSLLLKSKQVRKKSYLPLIASYLLLSAGSTGVFFAAIIALFSMGSAFNVALLFLVASILVLILGILLLLKGSKLEGQARVLTKQSKEILKPYQEAKPPKQPMKKSSKKLLYAILGGYLLLQLGFGILSAL